MADKIVFDRLCFEVEPTQYPGKFAAKVLLWHRGICVYSEKFADNERLSPIMAKVSEQTRIEGAKIARGKYEASPRELPPTTKVD